MAFFSNLIRRFNLPDNDTGPIIAKLTFASLVASNSSFIISLLSYRIASSIMLTCVWGLTLLHHLTIWRLLSKSQMDTATAPADVSPQSETRSQHLLSIILLHRMVVRWLYEAGHYGYIDALPHLVLRCPSAHVKWTGYSRRNNTHKPRDCLLETLKKSLSEFGMVS